MTTQQDAADLYSQLQRQVADTAPWPPRSPQADEDAEQAADIAPWYTAHPNALYGRALLVRWLAALCLFGAGLAVALGPLYFYRRTGDGRWMAASLVGWLIVYLVWRACRARK